MHGRLVHLQVQGGQQVHDLVQQLRMVAGHEVDLHHLPLHLLHGQKADLGVRVRHRLHQLVLHLVQLFLVQVQGAAAAGAHGERLNVLRGEGG